MNADTLSSIPDLSGDSRVRVFRRTLNEWDAYAGMQVDSYLLFTERYVIVCDTLLCPEDMAIIMAQVHDEFADKQLIVVNSHADWDHSWGNSYFRGERAVPILAHSHCRARLQSSEARTQLADYQQRTALFRNVVLTPPTVTFNDTLSVYGGDLTLELFHAPGHQPDHIAGWLPEIKLLLTFDAVERPFPTIGDADGVQPLLDTVERFLRLQPERVLCSHGGTNRVDLINANLAYLQEIMSRCRHFLASSAPPTPLALEQASQLVAYPLDAAIAGIMQPGEQFDRTFYGWVHDHNIRCIFQWLMGQTQAATSRE